MSGYVLGYAGFTLLGGRAADLLGRRRMFLTWLGVFLVFSMLGGFATDGWMLVVARFVTGVAAAFMTPRPTATAHRARCWTPTARRSSSRWSWCCWGRRSPPSACAAPGPPAAGGRRNEPGPRTA
ncbi:transmembrane efflux protein [Streptomyces sparsogenes DSM 40356]|uniref:Transmembrane efflux protein n=1 Tax=Streptomyces sparsogenes DSM 40356 TaxID=1331668 RepID=A0A1R1SAH5_9ACTN|nr:transmembrane efflux protein [Streptomyces sparsogenes DSM 40356]